MDGLAPFPALVLVGGTSALSALLVLLATEPRVLDRLRRLGAQVRTTLAGRRLEPAVAGQKGGQA